MEITLSELMEIFKGEKSAERHPLCGKRVLAVSTHGFVHVGLLGQEGTHLYLTDAKNIRYWSKRDGGLPELAEKGFLEDDRIDKCHEPVWLSSLVFLTETKA